MTLTDELAGLLNLHSRENASNTPDFILAQFMTGCLLSFEQATRDRSMWFDYRERDSICGAKPAQERPL